MGALRFSLTVPDVLARATLPKSLPKMNIAPNIGLKLNMDRLTLKCYMADTGMIIENMVAQMLTARGHKLYFYSNPSRDDVTERMEIDFLIAKSKISNRHNISPIEVKSSKNYTLTSLKKCIAKYGAQLNTPYVLHTRDYKEEDGIQYLPLYITPLL